MPGLALLGMGTQQVEGALGELFPRARVARLDRDTAARRGIASILGAMRERRIDLLVGTQMVTKGHDFPGVTLVGVLLADQGLRLPDFRAAERTFQLLTQVAGRAGRGLRPGRVFVQTYAPEHHAVQAARAQDYEAFRAVELELRRGMGFPPFQHMIAVHFEGQDAEVTETVARRVAAGLEARLVAQRPMPASMLGPAPAAIRQIRGWTRWQLWLRSPDRPRLRTLLPGLVAALEEVRASGVRTAIDVDPISVL